MTQCFHAATRLPYKHRLGDECLRHQGFRVGPPPTLSGKSTTSKHRDNTKQQQPHPHTTTIPNENGICYETLLRYILLRHCKYLLHTPAGESSIVGARLPFPNINDTRMRPSTLYQTISKTIISRTQQLCYKRHILIRNSR